MGPSHWDTQRGDRWGGQGSDGVGLHQAHGCPTSVLTIRTPIHPGTLPPCSGPRAQHSWMPHLLPESPCPPPGFFMLAEVPPSNPKPGSPHAYLSCSSGAIFHFAAHPLGWVPQPWSLLRVSQFALQTPLQGFPLPTWGKCKPLSPLVGGRRAFIPGVWAVPHLGLDPSTSPVPRGQKADCGGPKPTHCQSRNQPTLLQDSQEGDRGQKSHFVLHGGGGSVGPGWTLRGLAVGLLSPLSAAQRLTQKRKSGALSPPLLSGGGWGRGRDHCLRDLGSLVRLSKWKPGPELPW